MEVRISFLGKKSIHFNTSVFFTERFKVYGLLQFAINDCNFRYTIQCIFKVVTIKNHTAENAWQNGNLALN